MLRLGLRFAVAGGRTAISRLAMIAIAVAVGTTLLLTTLAGINALRSQDGRLAWLETASVPESAPDPTADPLWWRVQADHYDGDVITRLDLAATGPEAPVPPGMDAIPGAGQYLASPAMIDLLADAPTGQLADRYPGELAGVIGDDALPGPDALLIVIGRPPAELAADAAATKVTTITTERSGMCTNNCPPDAGYSADGMVLVLTVVVAALLVPVLIFIGGATRLSAARREQRFAALRLVGATPRQIARVATVESVVAAAVGVVAGLTLFAALRPVIAGVPFTGERFFATDLRPTLANVLLVVVGIPVGAAIAARVALRRVRLSPLGVRRRATPSPPRPWRVVPLLAGLGELAYLAYISDIGGAGKSSTTQAYAYLVGVVLVMVGLVVAGPWITMAASRLVVRRASGPSSLIAGRRLADDPRGGFRAISGLVLALFVASGSIGVITSIVANNSGRTTSSSAASDALVQLFDQRGAGEAPMGAGLRAQLTAIDGVSGVVEMRLGPTPAAGPDDGRRPPLLVDCAELAMVDGFGSCAAGARVAEVRPEWGSGVIDRAPSMDDVVWPTSALPVAEVERSPVGAIVVGTDGTVDAVEQARTTLLRRPADAPGQPPRFEPQTLRELNAHNTRDLQNYRRLADVVILASLPIAGCSLAVSIAAGLADRKRPFSLLRLAGAPLRTLRNVVLLESAVPLLVGAVAAIGSGLLCADLFLRAQAGYPLVSPSASFYVLAVAGVVAALGVIASTLPLLPRLTGPEVARND